MVYLSIATPPQPAAEEKEKEKEKEEEEEEEEESSSSESEEEFPDTQLAPVQQPKQEPDEAANEEWKKYELEQHGYDPDADKLPEFAQSGAAAEKKVFGVVLEICMDDQHENGKIEQASNQCQGTTSNEKGQKGWSRS